MKSVARLALPAVVCLFVLSSGGAAWAQGCCKAGICTLPKIPSTSAASDSAIRSVPAASQSLGFASTGQSAARSSSSAAREITLVNPSESGARIEYVLDGRSQSLEPGMSLRIATARPWKIEFARGDAKDKDMARYQVSQGEYEFAHTAQGWQLYRATR